MKSGWIALLCIGMLTGSACHAATAESRSDPSALCQEGGRAAGNLAYEKWASARSAMYSHGDGKQANPELQERWAKYDYMNKVDLVLGTAWLAIAEDVFAEVHHAPDAGIASEMGYSICMGRDTVPEITPKQVKKRGT